MRKQLWMVLSAVVLLLSMAAAPLAVSASGGTATGEWRKVTASPIVTYDESTGFYAIGGMTQRGDRVYYSEKVKVDGLTVEISSSSFSAGDRFGFAIVKDGEDFAPDALPENRFFNGMFFPGLYGQTRFGLCSIDDPEYTYGIAKAAPDGTPGAEFLSSKVYNYVEGGSIGAKLTFRKYDADNYVVTFTATAGEAWEINVATTYVDASYFEHAMDADGLAYLSVYHGWIADASAAPAPVVRVRYEDDLTRGSGKSDEEYRAEAAQKLRELEARLDDCTTFSGFDSIVSDFRTVDSARLGSDPELLVNYIALKEKIESSYWQDMAVFGGVSEVTRTDRGLTVSATPTWGSRLNDNRALKLKNGASATVCLDDVPLTEGNYLFFNFLSAKNSYKGESDGITVRISFFPNESFAEIYNFTDEAVERTSFRTPAVGETVTVSVSFEAVYDILEDTYTDSYVISVNEASLTFTPEQLQVDGHTVPEEAYFSVGCLANDSSNTYTLSLVSLNDTVFGSVVGGDDDLGGGDFGGDVIPPSNASGKPSAQATKTNFVPFLISILVLILLIGTGSWLVIFLKAKREKKKNNENEK